MKNWLLVWNVILTVLVLVLVLGGCTDQAATLANQVNANTVAIEQLKAQIAQQGQTIQAQSAQIVSVQANINTALQALQAQIPIIIQGYLQSIGK